jgi:hypothetical protein
MDQSLLQEAAFLLRKYYDGHGKDLEKFAAEVINIISKPQTSTHSKNSIKRVYRTADLIEGEEYLVIELPDPLTFSTLMKWDVYELEEIKVPAMSSTFKLNTDLSYKFIKEDSGCNIIDTKVLTLNDRILDSSIEVYRII